MGGTSMLNFNTILRTKIILTASLCIILASACQTTQNYGTTTEVDPSETRIVLPSGLNSLKGFKITGAKIVERGSFRSEQIQFTGGLFLYEQYFRGGFDNTNKTQLKNLITQQFKDASSIGEIKGINLNIGHTFHTTFFTKGSSCFIMVSNQGASVHFNTGTGTAARTLGLYCEQGQVDLEGPVLKWLKKVKLR